MTRAREGEGPEDGTADPPADLVALPKAHLHLHLTGGMRPATLAELAAEQGRRLPPELLDPAGARVDVTVRHGWTRFQRRYDAARTLLQGEPEVRRVLREIVEDQAAAGAGWLELQVDPSSYAARLGGLQRTVDVVREELGAAAARTGVGVGLVLAANRTRHPADAEALARVARRSAAEAAPVPLVGFGLSNDETRGDTAAFAKAFRLAREAGLAGVPHAGELRGPRSVRDAVELLGASRLGHGVRAVEDPALLEEMALLGVACEVCPTSNAALGVMERVPVRELRAAGVEVALGADDPLLFRAGLVDQYARLRDLQGLDDAELADLAASSVRASFAPDDVRARLLAGVAAWAAGRDAATGGTGADGQAGDGTSGTKPAGCARDC